MTNKQIGVLIILAMALFIPIIGICLFIEVAIDGWNKSVLHSLLKELE